MRYLYYCWDKSLVAWDLPRKDWNFVMIFLNEGFPLLYVVINISGLTEGPAQQGFNGVYSGE